MCIRDRSIAHLEKYYPGHGEEYAVKLRDFTIALYKKCADYALSRGIIIADTKFEFGPGMADSGYLSRHEVARRSTARAESRNFILRNMFIVPF